MFSSICFSRLLLQKLWLDMRKVHMLQAALQVEVVVVVHARHAAAATNAIRVVQTREVHHGRQVRVIFR